MENWVRNNGLAITFVYCTLVTISIVWAGYHTPIELRGGCLNKFEDIGARLEEYQGKVDTQLFLMTEYIVDNVKKTEK